MVATPAEYWHRWIGVTDVKQSRILVVDDNPNIVLMLAGLLESNGFRVLTAAGGETAIDCAVTEQPDLILLDIRMPDLDGTIVFSTFRQISQTCRIPVIFLTGYDPSERHERIMEIGFCDLLRKPIDPIELLVRIRAMLQTCHIEDKDEHRKQYIEAMKVLRTQGGRSTPHGPKPDRLDSQPSD